MSITQNTLSVALAGGPPSKVGLVTPVSLTGITAPGPNKSNRVILWIDREAMEVLSINSVQGTASVVRGVLGTLQVAHNAGTPIWIGKESDFSFFMQTENGEDGFGLYSRFTVSFESINPTTAIGTATLTMAQILGGFITGTPVGAANYTTPTAALMLAGIATFGTPYIGMSFEFTIYNTSAGANTITLVGGTNVSIIGTATVTQNSIKRFRVVVNDPTGVTNPSITIYSLGTSTA